MKKIQIFLTVLLVSLTLESCNVNAQEEKPKEMEK
jgi:predicted small secreted protein